MNIKVRRITQQDLSQLEKQATSDGKRYVFIKGSEFNCQVSKFESNGSFELSSPRPKLGFSFDYYEILSRGTRTRKTFLAYDPKINQGFQEVQTQKKKEAPNQ